MRRAGRELLSLALIDARNHTLHLLSLYEQALGSAALAVPRQEDIDPPLWLAGHIGWFAEWWIARNTQRAFGAECPVRPTRLAAIEPEADGWWNPAQVEAKQRWSLELPDLEQTKAYLLDTLESTLELLEHAVETDAGLYFYRLALFHEDLRGEQLVVMAQTLGLPLGIEARPAPVEREPLLLPATAGRSVSTRPASPSRRSAAGARWRCRSSRSMRSPSPGASTWSSSTTAATTARNCGCRAGSPGSRPRPRAGAARAMWSRSARRAAAAAARCCSSASAAPCARPATRARCM